MLVQGCGRKASICLSKCKVTHATQNLHPNNNHLKLACFNTRTMSQCQVANSTQAGPVPLANLAPSSI